MRTYTKTFNGVEVKAYNDSNCDWVINAKGFTAQRFDQRKITMRDAMELVARVAAQ